jgi:hypothetical protein
MTNDNNSFLHFVQFLLRTHCLKFIILKVVNVPSKLLFCYLALHLISDRKYYHILQSNKMGGRSYNISFRLETFREAQRLFN